MRMYKYTIPKVSSFKEFKSAFGICPTVRPCCDHCFWNKICYYDDNKPVTNLKKAYLEYLIEYGVKDVKNI